MNRLIVRTLQIRRWSLGPCVSGQLHVFRSISSQSEDKPKNYEEYTQERIFNRTIGGKSSLLRRLINSEKQLHQTLNKDLQELLDKAGAKLYYDCSNNIPYLALLKEFSLPDYMSSWFKLTLLHVWLCLLRLHTALDAAAYQRIQQSMLSSLWYDVDNRLETMGKELNQKLNTKGDIKKMHGLYLQTLLEYDEGFLDTDCMLASAVWRNLYMNRAVDPVYLNNVVKYIRATVAHLDTIDSNELVVSGIKKWETAEQIAQLN